MSAELSPAAIQEMEALPNGAVIIGLTLGGGKLHGTKRTGPDGTTLWDIEELGGAYRTGGLARVGANWKPEKRKAE